MIPNSTIITKLTNGNVSVTAVGGDFTILPSSQLTKELDGVKVRSDEGVLYDFKAVAVEKVVRDDATEVVINDVEHNFKQNEYDLSILAQQKYFFDAIEQDKDLEDHWKDVALSLATVLVAEDEMKNN